MTNEDIIKTAFKVWGRELYKIESLTSVARELGVSKAAIYRHFADKQALLDAMTTVFFDNYAAFVKKGFEQASITEDMNERFLIMMRVITEFYGKNRDAFVFSLIHVFGRPSMKEMPAQMISRGVDMRVLMKFTASGTQGLNSPAVPP